MTTYPLFIYAEFEPCDENPCPLTPLTSVWLGYDSNGLVEKEFKADHSGLRDVSNGIFRFCRSYRDMVLVGWDLRNLVWPAIVLNMAKEGWNVPSRLALQMSRKWNDAPLVDMRNVVLQGGFWDSSDKRLSLDEAYSFITSFDSKATRGINKVYDLYKEYVHLDAKAD